MVDSQRLPLHFFISYSHDDDELVRQIVLDLRRHGIPSWLDNTGILPGTVDWEKVIREAMRQSYAVLLIASPTSRQSWFVQGEIRFAQDLGLKIYPLWVAGEKWTDSISLGLVNTLLSFLHLEHI